MTIMVANSSSWPQGQGLMAEYHFPGRIKTAQEKEAEYKYKPNL